MSSAEPPRVDLPTDLIARNIPRESDASSTTRNGSQPLDDASRALYKPSGNRKTAASASVNPPTFTDPDLLAAGVVIKAAHITELRNAINDLRVRFGFARYTWTKPTNTNGVVAPGGSITADPIIEMRTALDEVLGPPSPAYAGDLAQGQPVRALHIQELRDRVVAGWNVSSQIPRDGYASLSYDTGSNRITTSGFAYDNAGNQLRALIPGGGGSQRYKYDAANRMVQVLTDNGTTVLASYTYGDSNERLISDEGGYRTYFACEGGSTIAEYMEPDGTSVPAWSKSYVYLGNRLLSTLTPNGAGGEAVEYHHPDRLGTRLITNPTTGGSYEQVTLPFGTALNAESTGSTNKRFTSYDRSDATKLDYAVNRHYDPQQGRFTQVDPIGMRSVDLTSPQTLNLYAYCANDPINQVDPSGLGFFSFLKKFFSVVLKTVLVAAAVVAAVVGVLAIAGALLPFMGAGAGWALVGLSALGFAQAFGPPWLRQGISVALTAIGIYFRPPQIIWNLMQTPSNTRSLNQLASLFGQIGAISSFLAQSPKKLTGASVSGSVQVDQSQNPDAPCEGSANQQAVISEEDAVAAKLRGSIKRNQVPYPGFNVDKYGLKDLIDTYGQSFSNLVSGIEKQGFSPIANFNEEHFGGNDYAIQMPSGRYYHITVGRPTDWYNPFSSSRPPWITIHCHGSHPEGWPHIKHYLHKGGWF